MASIRRIRGHLPTQSPCPRSEEHTSELQSHLNLVCRLLLEKSDRDKGGSSGAPDVVTDARGQDGGRDPGGRASGYDSFFFKDRGDPRDPPLFPNTPFPA